VPIIKKMRTAITNQISKITITLVRAEPMLITNLNKKMRTIMMRTIHSQ
jgi:hypothetical protein